VLADKQAILDCEHATPRCIRRPAAADLAQAQWPVALAGAGFNPGTPAAFVAEGLTYYLPEKAAAVLLDQAASIATPGSRLGVDMVSADYLTNPAVTPYLDASRGARWQFGTNDPGGFLAAHGWQADLHDMFAVARSLGRWPPPGSPRRRSRPGGRRRPELVYQRRRRPRGPTSPFRHRGPRRPAARRLPGDGGGRPRHRQPLGDKSCRSSFR